MAELARQLEDQQKESEQRKETKDADSSVCNQAERALSSELDHSEVEYDYRKAAFGNSSIALSP
ncbi:Fluconazole resistance protein 1 [Fusarium falciforme]